MENKIRKGLSTVIAFVMAFIMAFGTTPAFAAEIGDLVLWDEGFTEETWYDEHCYGGKLAEGENHLTPFLSKEVLYYYYEFDAKKSGYYLISNDVYYGEFGDDGILYYVEHPMDGQVEIGDEYYDVVYLEEGTAIIGLSFTDYETLFDYIDVEIKYIDDEITDIVYDEKILENLIINEDITFYGDSFEFYDTDYTVVFSNGVKYEFPCETLVFKIKTEPVNGENTVYATFAGYEEEAVATMYYIDYFVESVELSNVDNYLKAYEYYNGRYGFIDYNDEKITVNYTDGTSETFLYGHYEEEGQKRYITLFGKEYFVGIWHSETYLTLEVHIAEQTFAEYECKTVKANSFSNREYLKDNLKDEYDTFVYCMNYYWTNMTNPEHIEFFLVNAKYFFENFTRLADMAEEIAMYIRFVYA